MSIHHAAQEILEIVANGEYTTSDGQRVSIRSLQRAAAAGTETLSPEALDSMFRRERDPAAPGASGGAASARAARIEVLDATTQGAALSLAQAPGGVVILNFASARNPGGGFLGGAKAQEEEICRCSGLYPLLANQHAYYEANRANRSALYTDHMIYSRDVPFFRTSARRPWLSAPFVASVITAPAPNAGAIRQNEPSAASLLPETFRRRWRNVLVVAEARGHRTLVLGAWGCGAFQNNPEVAAETLAPWLKDPRFEGAFDHVVLAIPDGGKSGENLAAFRKCFEGAS